MGSRRFKKLILSCAGAISIAGTAYSACSEDQVSLRGDFGEAQFTVDVADDASERARGLMFVEQMATMQGMLFVYERPQSVSFWMRNTLIPLDLVFVDDTGVVRNIHSMAQPLDETPIYGGEGIQYVLEINGGLADRLGLSIGDEMRHTSFGGDVNWPCEMN